MSEATDAIERLSEEYSKAYQQGDGAGLAQMFWDDAAIIPSGKKAVVGRRSIDSFFSGVSGGSSLTNEESYIVADGDIGYDYGSASWMEDGKKRFLHFVDVYRRKDGAWRIQLSTWNSSEEIAE